MALTNEMEIRDVGVSAKYHRILRYEVTYVAVPGIEGAIGTGSVTVVSYVSEDTRRSGANPLSCTDLAFTFGGGIREDAHLDHPHVLFVRSDEPDRSDIYTAIAGSPVFSG